MEISPNSRANHLVALSFLDSLEPPLATNSRQALLSALESSGQGLSCLSRLDGDALKEIGVVSPMERASLLAAAADGGVMAPPPRMDPPGPVVVEVKFGFIELSAIDTINQSFRCRFFLDLTWEDPRLIGASSVPDGTWFPKGVYIINAHGALDIAAYSKPILVDSATGRVLWAQDIQGAITNQMSLAAFPFDTDVLEVYVHQAEEASRDEYVLRPYGGGWNGYRTRSSEETLELESRSTQCFFDVFTWVDEWSVGGFSIEAYETVGGNGVEYSECHLYLHVARRWTYYAWKIVLPLCICTAFCLTAFLYEAEDLANRNGISVTMFLATSALLFVVAALLPKTSYLTAIDRFVVQTLVIQFAIGVWSWLMFAVVRVRLDEGARDRADLVAFFVLAGAYVLCVCAFFWRPLLAGNVTDDGRHRLLARQGALLERPTPPPPGLSGHQLDSGRMGDDDETRMTRFHRFEMGRNVWPRKVPGELPLNMLQPHWSRKEPGSLKVTSEVRLSPDEFTKKGGYAGVKVATASKALERARPREADLHMC